MENNSPNRSIPKNRSSKSKLSKKLLCCSGSTNSYKCHCSNCKCVNRQMEQLKTTQITKDPACSCVCIGDRVLLKGKFPGTVRYVGNLDSPFVNSKIFVGVKLDDPVGIHDGIHKGKRYFKCPPSHGVFVPLSHAKLICVPNRKASVSPHIASSNRSSTRQQNPIQKVLNRPKTALYRANPSLNSDHDHTSTIPIVGSRKSQSNSSCVSNGEHSTTQHLPMIKLSISSLLNRSPSNSNEGSSDEKSCKNCTSSEESVNHTATVGNEASTVEVLSNFPSLDKTDDSKAQSYKNLKNQNFKTSSASHFENELDILKWQERIQSMKKDPGTARIYLSSKPTFYREVPTDTEPADESNKETPLTKTFIQIEPAISYTSRLLSGIPDSESTTGISSDSKLKELEEFGYWFKKWGGDVRGLMMANTMQKLKDASRKGEKEIQWQKKIDELECDEEFGLQVEHIKDLHHQIAEVRRIRNNFEAKIRDNTFASSKLVAIRASILKYQKKAELEEKQCTQLEEAVKGHKRVSYLTDANQTRLLINHS